MAKENLERTTTRAQYKTIKKYDHHQMDVFVDSIYRSGKEIGYDAGYQQGYKTGCEGTFNVEKILEKISNIKGIGVKKLEEIRAALSGEEAAGNAKSCN